MKKLIFQLTILFFVSQKAEANPYPHQNYENLLSTKYNIVCAVDNRGAHCYSLTGEKFKKIHTNPLATGVLIQKSVITTITPQGIEHTPIPKATLYNHLRSSDTAVTDPKYIPPPLKEVRQIVSVSSADYGNFYYEYRNAFCALDKNGMSCWHYGKTLGQLTSNPTRIPTPALNNPKAISGDFKVSGQNGVITDFCAVDDDGIKCFKEEVSVYVSGPFNAPFKYDVKYRSSTERNSKYSQSLETYHKIHSVKLISDLKNPINSAGSDNYIACAMDDTGLVCWGARGYVVRIDEVTPDLPKFHKALVELGNLDLLLQILVTGSTPAKAIYFRQMDSLLKSKTVWKEKMDIFDFYSARYLINKLITPAILSIDAPNIAQYVTPPYQESLLKIENNLQIEGISMLPKSDFNKRLAVQSIKAALNVLKEFQPAKNRNAFIPVDQALNQAMARPTDDVVKRLLSSLDSISALLSASQSNPKSAFLVDTILLAKEWLGGK